MLSDIYGLTEAFRRLAQSIHKDAIVIGPYDSDEVVFTDETKAYTYFSQQTNVIDYAAKVQSFLENSGKAAFIVGFSVGASALWHLSAQHPQWIVAGIGYYGSQIRNALELRPCVPVDFVFPKYEVHFDVQDVIECLRELNNVTVSQVPYLHGFMNALSPHFEQSCCIAEMSRIRQLVTNIEKEM